MVDEDDDEEESSQRTFIVTSTACDSNEAQPRRPLEYKDPVRFPPTVR